MLRYLRIRDFALIRELEIEFGPGLNLLTGETGSGKSIIVDALGLLLGGRASPEMVRSGCEQAVLEAVFSTGTASVLRLEEAGIPPEDDLILIRREIFVSGRSRVFINNTLTTRSLLATLGEMLGDIHGQHDHQTLLQVSNHLALLDQFGGNKDQVLDLAQHYSRLREIAGQLDSMVMDEQERLKRVDILQYQLDEINRAHLRPQEREELEQEKSILANHEKIFSLARELYALLYESDASILTQTNRACRILEELERFDSRWGAHKESLSESLYKLEDTAYFARDYTADMDFSPERLDQLEERLSELDRLGRKYGQPVSEILQYAARCDEELQNLISYKDRSEQLEEQLEAALKTYLAHARELSEKRHKDARRLEKESKREFLALAMEKMEFRVHLQPREKPIETERVPGYCTASGIDRAEFLVSPNKGEELKPLARIASGGELSRIILALKTLGGGDEGGRTLVFDEVDAGIGGRVAESVGRRLRTLASNSQVLCVTHLPQIAAFAHHHFSIQKETIGQRTETSIHRLSDSDRVQELARMLGGETITETTRRHAQEMLEHSLSSASGT